MTSARKLRNRDRQRSFAKAKRERKQPKPHGTVGDRGAVPAGYRSSVQHNRTHTHTYYARQTSGTITINTY